MTAFTAASAMVLAACGASSTTASKGPTQTALSAKQTIVFATQGLGTEGSATKAAVAGFEKANPNIHVTLLVLSPSSNNAYQQLTQRFIAKSSTPDVVTTDVIWPATFAKAGWIAPLTQFHPNTGAFFAGQVKSGTYNGKTYAMPWFINAEGIYYRTDLIPTPPTTPAQLVKDAKAAMAKDPALKEGFAFEGAKYEGAVTAFINFLGGFGGSLNPANLDTKANVAALTFMQNTIYKYKIAPTAVTGWEEPNVQSAFLSGQAPFAMNWPYIFALAEAPGSKLAGKVGWIPFPSNTGTPQAALGGDDLAINANSTHKAAAWALIKYLTSSKVQLQRAVAAGDPPSTMSSYNSTLYSKAPYFRQEKAVFKYATSRPVTPVYPSISSKIQTMLSSVLSNQATPKAALAAVAPKVKSIAASASSSGG
ncbi:MAG: ABC transporter substrate-binding protein [Acidimicrobiales bacterium]